MPIIFRCQHCQQKLSVSSKKAGRSVDCPKCSNTIQIPVPEPEPDDAPLLLTPERKSPDKKTAPPKAPVAKTDSPTKPKTAEERPAAKEPVPSSVQPADTKPQSTEEAIAARHGYDDDDEGEGFAVRGPETDFEDMDLTPMVDVTFLLLIFFMITASFSTQKTIDVPAPDPDQQGAAQTIQNEQDLEEFAIMVLVDSEDQIFVDDVPVEIADLEDTFKDKAYAEEKNELVIEVSPDATHRTVVKIIDAGNGAEMQKIRLASRAGAE